MLHIISWKFNVLIRRADFDSKNFKKEKTSWSFSIDRAELNCHKATEPQQGGSLVLNTKSP